jgi:putative membrane protein
MAFVSQIAAFALAVDHPVSRVSWTAWTIHWSTVIGLAALGAAYLWGARHLRARAVAAGAEPPALERKQRMAFFGGLTVIFVSLNGPLHDLSDTFLFSAHMVQHLLLSLAVPPLLLAGTPGWMLRPFLENARVAAIARAITRPVRCFIIFNVVIAAWHLPPLYNTAMAHHSVHIVQHLTFLVASVLMWWPFLSPLPELPRLAYPGQMLYCFLMVIPMSIVAIYIAMADHVLYPAYSSAPRVWDITPLSDQQIGGLIMWVPGGLLFYVVMTFVFFKWAGRDTDTTAGAQVDWRPSTPRPRIAQSQASVTARQDRSSSF